MAFVLPDSKIEKILFLRPPEGSKDKLEYFDLDELVCNNKNVICVSYIGDIALPRLNRNILFPNFDLDPSETSSSSPLK